jgi:hypothetical protein
MINSELWREWNELAMMIRTAYGLALLADCDCASDLCIPEEQEAAREAPAAACRILREACALVNELEPKATRRAQ